MTGIHFRMTVCIADYTAGIWRVSLDPVEAGGPYNVTAACENGTATLTDVLFGDIWLCGGQSNMFFKTSQVSFFTCITFAYQPTFQLCQVLFYSVSSRFSIHQRS